MKSKTRYYSRMYHDLSDATDVWYVAVHPEHGIAIRRSDYSQFTRADSPTWYEEGSPVTKREATNKGTILPAWEIK